MYENMPPGRVVRLVDPPMGAVEFAERVRKIHEDIKDTDIMDMIRSPAELEEMRDQAVWWTMWADVYRYSYVRFVTVEISES